MRENKNRLSSQNGTNSFSSKLFSWNGSLYTLIDRILNSLLGCRARPVPIGTTSTNFGTTSTKIDFLVLDAPDFF